MAVSNINLSRGMPPVEVFPVDDIIQCAVASLKNDPHKLLQYGRSPGYLPLRELLGGWYRVGPDQVLVGNSSLEISEFIARTILGPGKRAFVEVPTYDRTIVTYRRVGAEVVGIPMDEDGMNIDALEAEIRKGKPTLLYTIADFQNPLGITTSLKKRQAIAKLAQQHDFWVVEDAPYRALRYVGEQVPTIYEMAPDHTYHLSSFSKTLAPGLRLGYAVAPATAIAKLAAYAVDTYIGPVFPTQGLVYEYCRAGLLDANLAKLKTIFAPRMHALLAALEKHMPGATWTHPEGGYYVGLTLPKGSSVERLLARTKDAGLTLSDGRGFYPNPSDGDRFVRIPFCSVTPEDLEEGVARLAKIV